MNINSPVLECIPNFSEGKNESVIAAIANAINKIQGQKLLHIDRNFAANRSVFTFCGDPQAVVDAAFEAIKVAVAHIDMRVQTGAHPRIGAADVCPLVPLYNMTMEDAMVWADKLAAKVARELNVPVYLYEHSAKASHRKTLPQIRKGGYEGLLTKMEDAKWQPDYGPTLAEGYLESVARTGATVVGARDLLVAFNVSLDTKNVAIAKQIAGLIRSSGYWTTDIKTGERRLSPGLLPHLRAIGWYIDDFGTAQVSMNLLDYKLTSPVKVWETVSQLANSLGTTAVGCELIGLIPEVCLTEAGIRYLEINGDNTSAHGKTKDELIQYGINYLKLDRVKAFDPKQQVLEQCIVAQFPNKMC